MINALDAANDVPSLRKVLMQLYKHTREHFELEEALMRKVRFPDTLAHTQSHNNLLARLNALSQDVGQGKVDKLAINKLMTDWAMGHVVVDDAKIAAFIDAQG
jgi:hemerythrin-like metal-binding protein